MNSYQERTLAAISEALDAKEVEPPISTDQTYQCHPWIATAAKDLAGAGRRLVQSEIETIILKHYRNRINYVATL